MRASELRRRLLSDWPAKVLSLGAALLLFFFYQLNRLEVRYISVPLEVRSGEDFVPASQYPRSVRVTLRGESNALFAIQEDDIAASLDLSSFRSEGLYRAAVQIERRGTALGVDPLEIQVDPADVAVSMERRASRAVPVTPSFRGFLQSGYELVSFEIEPPDVEIYGPASAVAKVGDVQTEFIELTGRSADFAVKAKLVKKDDLVTVSGAGTVDFRAVVKHSQALRAFDQVEVEAEGLADRLVLAEALPKASLRLRPKADSEAPPLDQLPAGTIYVDLSGVRRSGTYEMAVRVKAPEGFEVEDYEPKDARVVLADAETGAR
jgi:YbbR domain-containing protein